MLARQLSSRFDQGVERIGVSRAKFGALAVIARHPGVTQRHVAEVLKVSEVTAGRLIERLCADGYVERRESPGDRRAHSVYLTATAQPLMNQLSVLANTQELEAFTGLEEDELAQLDALLQRIADNISAGRGRMLSGLPDPQVALDPAAAVTRG